MPFIVNVILTSQWNRVLEKNPTPTLTNPVLRKNKAAEYSAVGGKKVTDRNNTDDKLLDLLSFAHR